jgi:phage terminase small subunit
MARKRISLADIYGVGISDPKRANFVIEYSKDFDARRAAAVSGYAADYGYKLRDDPEIQAALEHILTYRLETSHVDAEWLLWELVDNHQIARAAGNISASNTALNTLAKHAMIDAFAAEKVEIAGDEAIKERLLRARKRMQKDNKDGDDVSFM